MLIWLAAAFTAGQVRQVVYYDLHVSDTLDFTEEDAAGIHLFN